MQVELPTFKNSWINASEELCTSIEMPMSLKLLAAVMEFKVPVGSIDNRIFNGTVKSKCKEVLH